MSETHLDDQIWLPLTVPPGAGCSSLKAAALIERLRAAKASKKHESRAAADHIKQSVNRMLAHLRDPDLPGRLSGEPPTLDGGDDAALTPEPRKRRRLTFTKRDLTRAIAGHMQAGLSVQRTEIDKTGRIVIVTGRPEAAGIKPENEWDSVK